MVNSINRSVFKENLNFVNGRNMNTEKIMRMNMKKKVIIMKMIVKMIRLMMMLKTQKLNIIKFQDQIQLDLIHIITIHMIKDGIII